MVGQVGAEGLAVTTGFRFGSVFVVFIVGVRCGRMATVFADFAEFAAAVALDGLHLEAVAVAVGAGCASGFQRHVEEAGLRTVHVGLVCGYAGDNNAEGRLNLSDDGVSQAVICRI